MSRFTAWIALLILIGSVWSQMQFPKEEFNERSPRFGFDLLDPIRKFFCHSTCGSSLTSSYLTNLACAVKCPELYLPHGPSSATNTSATAPSSSNSSAPSSSNSSAPSSSNSSAPSSNSSDSMPAPPAPPSNSSDSMPAPPAPPSNSSMMEMNPPMMEMNSTVMNGTQP